MGWNWRALVALVTGIVLAVGGAYSALDATGAATGPFPADGLIPVLKPLYDYSWVVGLAAAFLIYVALTMISPMREITEEEHPVAAAEVA